MLGNAISGFAVGLMALDFTGSVFLMVLVNVVYNLPRVLLPALAGPYLDRFSRVRAIYSLDFLSAAIYALLAGLLFTGWFRYWLMLLAAPVLGAIDSVYATAYDSLFPTLASKENLPKAYSVSSLITPLASAMVPVAAYLYGRMGLAPMFAINAASFLAAALFETRIRVRGNAWTGCAATWRAWSRARAISAQSAGCRLSPATTPSTPCWAPARC